MFLMKKALSLALSFCLLSTMLTATAAAESTLTVTHEGSVGTAVVATDPLEAVFTIGPETLKTYAWVNDAQLQGSIKEVALDIQGLNNGHAYKTTPEEVDIELGKSGVLVVRPYSGPWNWMSFETIAEIDDILDAVWAKYDLPEDLPLVAFGRSMGGIGVLNYARYGAHPLTAVAANSPVTDLAYHATERPDCAATMYRAYSYYDCSVAQAIQLHNPMNFINELPDIPYFIVHGDADVSVNKQVHSDTFVPAARALGYDVTYVEVPGMAHVDLAGHPEAGMAYLNFIASFAK
jgi:S-formylglutathione hydrolase FrmB